MEARGPRPDEDTARNLLRSWVTAMARRNLPHPDIDLDLAEFDSGRLELQRTNEWIQTELEALAAERSDLLVVRRDDRTGTVRFRARPLPR